MTSIRNSILSHELTHPLQTPSYVMLYNSFCTMLVAKGYKVFKSSSYHTNVNEFLSFLEKSGVFRIRDVKMGNVLDYIDHLNTRKSLKKKRRKLTEVTKNGHMVVLRLFFKHLVEIGSLKGSPLWFPRIKFEKKPRYVLKLEEVKQLYEVCQNTREKAVLSIAYGCGLRRSEIYLLNCEDINFSKNTLVVKYGKKGTNRLIPLSDSVATHLKNYMQKRESYLMEGVKTQAFLINNVGTRMCGLTMNNILKALAKRTKNESLIKREVCIHCLRHSIATHLLDNGARIEFVKRLLGHSFLDSTHHYTRTRKLRKSIIDQLHENK